MPKHEIQVLLFDRSNPDQVVAVSMKDGQRYTALDELRRKNGAGRSDIVMVNFWDGNGECNKQLCAYPTWSGEPSGEAMEWLSTEQVAEARAINARIIATAAVHPEFEKYLGRRAAEHSIRV